jgi:hypothetical protein
MSSACHVIGCHSTQERRVQNALDDVASTIHEILPASASGSPTGMGGREIFTTACVAHPANVP